LITELDIVELRRIALQAGDAVMDVYRSAFSASAKEDASPLTDADLRSDAVIRQHLNAAFPGVSILSEESGESCGSAADCMFLIDPLDGTREFIQRNGEFTVNIALVREGRPVAGIVHAPALGETFCAAEGLGCWTRVGAEDRVLQAAQFDERSALRVIGSRSHDSDRLRDWLDSLAREFSLVTAGSSLKFCRLAEGKADVYPRLGSTSQWDTAAGQCILEQSGGAITATDGVPLLYGAHRPLVNPHFVAVGDPRLLSLLGPLFKAAA
jgi:3'(2'),5'-bisphosphate nucleotidase